MARVTLAEVFNLPFLGAYGGGAAATFVIAVAVARLAFPNRLGALGLAGLSAIFSNTGYMGIPLLMLAFGEARSEEHTSELPSLMRISSAVFCLQKNKKQHTTNKQ